MHLLTSTNKNGLPPLIHAVTLGNQEICEKLIRCGVDIDQVETNRTKRTALHYCLLQNQEDLFCLLLRHGAKADKPDYKRSVIQRSIQNNNQKFFHLLLDFCPMEDIEIANAEGASPLMIACQLEKPDTVRELIKHKADVKTKDKTSKTALHYCAENVETKCAELLLEADKSLIGHQDEDGYSPLHLAVIAGNVAICQFLLEKSADINCTDNEKHTAVHWATVCGQVEVMDILIQHGAEVSTPDIHNAYPVHYAAQMSGVANDGVDPKVGLEVLNKLIEKGVAVDCTDKDQRQPLLWAASAGSSEACLALMKGGAKPEATDKDGLTAMHCAASRGHPECIKVLHDHGGNVDCEDKNSCTPVFYAITLGHTDCTSLLLNLGANPNFQDKRGRSPAHCAAAKGSKDCIRFLMNKNANFWLKNAKGEFPVHEASQSGKTEIAKILVEYDEEQHLSKGNLDGRTCLHLACMTNNLELCKLLLDNNANINAVMKSKSQKEQYLTPLDVALIKGNTEIAEYLKANGAAPGKKVTSHAATIIQRSAKRRTQNQKKLSEKKSELSPSHSKTDVGKSGSRPTSTEPQKTLSPSEEEQDKEIKSERSEIEEQANIFMVTAVTASRSSLRSSRQGSPESSKARSRSASPSGSKMESPSRAQSPGGSGESKSKSPSPERSRSRSTSTSRSGSRHSKSNKSSRSKSRSRSRSRTDLTVTQALERERSRSRSRSRSSSRSHSGSSRSSSSQSKPSSRSRSRSESPASSRSRSGSKARSRSNSGSRERSNKKSRSRSRLRTEPSSHSRQQPESPSRQQPESPSRQQPESPSRQQPESPSQPQSKDHSPQEAKSETAPPPAVPRESETSQTVPPPAVPRESETSQPCEKTGNQRKSGYPFQDRNRSKQEETAQKGPVKEKEKIAPSVNGGKESDADLRPKTVVGSSRRPKTAPSRVAQEIVESVRQFEAIRQNAQDLHRLRRIQLYHGDYSDQLVLKKLMERRKNLKGDPDVQSVNEWEHYLCEQIKILTKGKDERGSIKGDKMDGSSSVGTLDSARSSKGERKHELHRESQSAKETDQKTVKERQRINQQKRQDQTQNRLRAAYKPEVFLEDTYRCNIDRQKRAPSSYSQDHKMQNGHLPKLPDESKRPSTVTGNKSETKPSASQQAKFIGSPAQCRAKLASAGRARYQETPNQKCMALLSFSQKRNVAAAWTPKYDGSFRPRDELVFISPQMYEEKRRKEATGKRMESLSV